LPEREASVPVRTVNGKPLRREARNEICHPLRSAFCKRF
jgi:hypothetical protein